MFKGLKRMLIHANRDDERIDGAPRQMRATCIEWARIHQYFFALLILASLSRIDFNPRRKFFTAALF